MATQFLPGCWYKNPKWPNFYIEVDKYVEDGKNIYGESCPVIYCKRIISDDTLKVKNEEYYYLLEGYTQVPIEEVAKYLPEQPLSKEIINSFPIY